MQKHTKRVSKTIGAVIGGVVLALLSTVAISQAAEPASSPPSQEKSAAKGDPGQIQERAIGGRVGGGLGYTCSDTIEGGRKCTCTDTADCLVLDASGKCDGKVTCPAGGTCGCEWKKPRTLQRTQPNMTLPRTNVAPPVAR